MVSIMIRFTPLLPLILFSFAATGADEVQSVTQERPVLVELFTSQGCANCPAANRFLAELGSDPNVITLSLAVDYWDYLGWKDTYAMSSFTKRQQDYGNSLHSRRPYTPQIIVGGQASVKGMRQKKVRKTIGQQQDHSATGPELSLTLVENHLRLTIAEGEAPVNGAVILIADYIPGVQQVSVEGGENNGKILDQVNMVTKLRPVGHWTGDAMVLDIPAMATGSCVAILQEAGPGRVLSVTRLAS